MFGAIKRRYLINFYVLSDEKYERFEMRDLILLLTTFIINTTISALIIWFAWNWVMPSVFSLPEIGFLPALGIRLLLRSVLEKCEYISPVLSGE